MTLLQPFKQDHHQKRVAAARAVAEVEDGTVFGRAAASVQVIQR
jgi:hypothetical protein